MAGQWILVTDDDASIRGLVAQALELEGYRVSVAINGLDALQAIEQRCPSVLLLDMEMPGLDGWGLARVLRKRGTSVPIIVMTAGPDARQWAAEIHADDYLAKPFDLGELVTKVEYLCGQRAAITNSPFEPDPGEPRHGQEGYEE